MLHQIKAPQFYTDLGLQKTVLNPLANVKIQGLFKVFECFQVLSRQILFSRTNQDSPVYSSTFQACSNPETSWKSPLVYKRLIIIYEHLPLRHPSLILTLQLLLCCLLEIKTKQHNKLTIYKFNTEAGILDSIYHMTLNLL